MVAGERRRRALSRRDALVDVGRQHDEPDVAQSTPAAVIGADRAINLLLELEVGDAGRNARRRGALLLERWVLVAQIGRVGGGVIGDVGGAGSMPVAVLDQRRERVASRVFGVVCDVDQELLDERLVAERAGRWGAVEVMSRRGPEDRVQCDVSHHVATVVDDGVVAARDELGNAESRHQAHRVADSRPEREPLAPPGRVGERDRPVPGHTGASGGDGGCGVPERHRCGYQHRRQRRNQLQDLLRAPHRTARYRSGVHAIASSVRI